MLRLRAASYRYPSGTSPAVGPLDLELAAGELTVLTGPTGCGKSTLLRLAAGILQRHGRGLVEGEVLIDGQDAGQLAASERVRLLGFVSQEPSDQIVAGSLGDEIGFGLESAGWELEAIEARVLEVLEQLGLPPEPERPALALSGGQRQKLVVAAALAAKPPLLLLDEPLAQLDPSAAQSLMERLRALAEGGVTVLLVEHRLEPTLPFADRLVVLDAGQIVWDGPAAQPELAVLRGLGLSLPGLLDLDSRLEGGLEQAAERLRCQLPPPPAGGPPGSTVLEARGLEHSYPGRSEPALSAVDLVLRAGERVAIVGGNGAGKSTLLELLSGQLRSAVVRHGRVVDVPQDPDLALFCSTVREELSYGAREARLDESEVVARSEHAATALSLEDLLDRAPQALSRGQRLRTAVAAALACQPAALLLDEPTAGQDRGHVEQMMAGLEGTLTDRLLVFATHDLDLALRHATRVLVLEDGRLVGDGPAASILARLPSGGSLFLPPLARWCHEQEVPYASPARLAELAREGR